MTEERTLFGYYWYSVVLGLRAVIKGHVIPGAKRLFNPVSFQRCVEIPWVLRVLDPQPGDVILDVGSPKLLSLYLVDRGKCRVVAVDLSSQFISEYKALLTAQGRISLWNSRYFAMVQDGRALSYKDASFDKVYSVSVVEHIPGQGDAQAICEMARVVRPGGLVALTVPYARHYREEWVKHPVYERKGTGSEEFFYQRAYDFATLQERLSTPSRLSIADCAFYSTYDLWDKGYMNLPLPLRALFGPLQPLLARVMIRPIRSDQARQERYNLACLLLRK